MRPLIVFIGSTVVDITMRVPHLPKQCEDINILSQHYSLGGCAFNASWISHLLQVQYQLFSPIGRGLYADFITSQMRQYELVPLHLHSEKENGSCCCIVDASGERSFLSYHGAEYEFKEEWFSQLDAQPVDIVYVCGLELEEESGAFILSYLQRHTELTIYFATGPRLHHIAQDVMDKLFALSPILHLNEEEALSYTNCSTLESAAHTLYEKTHNIVMITLGKDGCAYYDGTLHIVLGYPAMPMDTTGAGDSHIGAIIAYQALGYSFHESILKANYIASHVVSTQGAILSKEAFENMK